MSLAFAELSIRILGKRIQRSRSHVFLTGRFSRKEVVFFAKFNLCVWRVRRIAFMEKKHQSVSAYVTMFSNIFTPLRPVFPTDLEQKALARAIRKNIAKDNFEAFLGTLPPQALVFYTDGGREGQKATGHAGAGIVATRGKEIIFSDSIPLGVSTNNIAELVGCTRAAGVANAMIDLVMYVVTLVVIVLDSRYVVDILSGKSRSRTNRKLIYILKNLVTRLHAKTEVIIKYAPSHVGVQGNELADEHATFACRLSARGQKKDPFVIAYDTMD